MGIKFKCHCSYHHHIRHMYDLIPGSHWSELNFPVVTRTVYLRIGQKKKIPVLDSKLLARIADALC